MNNSYTGFLETKRTIPAIQGITIDPGRLNPMLYPFQRELVSWALRKQRAAIFADTGLGKTAMLLEWATIILNEVGGPLLVFSPLAVAEQTQRESKKFNTPHHVQICKSQDDIEPHAINITNYERLHRFDGEFNAIILDESSILKSIDGKTRNQLIEQFINVPYKLCCTATPAPNDMAEFGNHAEFLNIATYQEMLSRFFVHDDTWRLKGHAVDEFYRWLASWSVMIKSPSDLGFDDTIFQLPPLTTTPIFFDTNDIDLPTKNGQGQLFAVNLGGVGTRSAIRRTTLQDKVRIAAEIINQCEDQWISWVGLNDEGRELHKAVPDSVLIEGSDSIESKTKKLMAFINGDTRVLITKIKIAGFGLNLQKCHKQMFVGLNDSYEQFYQAIRRSWRFGQDTPVDVSIVIHETERPILDNIQSKEAMSEGTIRKMIDDISAHQKTELGLIGVTDRSYDESTSCGDDYKVMMGDCVERMKEIKTNSIDFSVFSPPFLSLYVYSDSERDMGNSRTETEFFEHFDYMASELTRIIKPGRLIACHVSQVPASLVHDGYIGLKDFRGNVIDRFMQAGCVYHGEVVVDKDPQAQAIRTKAKGLLFVQLKKDASWLRPGLADYILLFRVPGENNVPIKPDIDNETWIEWARPVWYNIRESDTLNAREARTEKDERHVAPLQLGTIERCIRLWSNKGETVFSPFMGIGSEGYQALLLDRKFIGIELKQEYYAATIKNLTRANEIKSQIPLEDIDDAEQR